MDKLIGRKCPYGPGGRDCACCGQPPGRDRDVKRRQKKRSERQEVKRQINREMTGTWNS